jgi:hypothetical protein
VKELATPPSREPLLLKMARVGFPGAERFNIFGDKSQLGNVFSVFQIRIREIRKSRIWIHNLLFGSRSGFGFGSFSSTSKKRENP